MAIFTVSKDDYGYYLNFTATDDDDTVINLTGKTVKLSVWNPRAPSTMILDGVAVDHVVAASGTCRRLVVDGDFDTAGVFFGKLNLSAVGYTEDLRTFTIVVTDGTEYVTLEEVQAELELDTNKHDGIIMSMIAQASQFIYKYCERQFHKETATRYFDGAGSTLFIDDLVTVTTFKLDEDGDGTYESTLATTDYVLYPLNKTPKTWVEISSNSDYGGFANGIKAGVEIVGIWGYSAVPDDIVRATLIQVCRWFQRRKNAYGTEVGTTELGLISVFKGLDDDIKAICSPYKRRM